MTLNGKEKPTIIGLYGKAGSGKDAILKWVCDKRPDKLNPIISMTTRPLREGEKNGVDYYFVDPDTFFQTEMLEHTSFNNWFYGTPISSIDMNKINIGVFNLSGVAQMFKLNTNNNIQFYPIQIICSDKERLLRQLNRETKPNCTEICRRFLADELDFVNQREIDKKYYFQIYNEYAPIAATATPLVKLIDDLGRIE